MSLSMRYYARTLRSLNERNIGRTLSRSLVPVFCGLAVSACSLDGTNSSSNLITNSIGPVGEADLNQPLPQSYASTNTNAKYMPQGDVGGVPMNNMGTNNTGIDAVQTASVSSSNGSIRQSTLPELAPAPVSSEMSQTMPNSSAATLSNIDQPMPQMASRPRMVSVPDSSVIHQVGRGESLYTIARNYDVSVESLYQANKMQPNDRLRIGQNLIVPGVSAAMTAKPAVQQVAAVTNTAPIVPKIAAKPRITASQVAQFQREAAKSAVPKPVKPEIVQQPIIQRDPIQTASVPASKITNLRWPVQGQVTAGFKANNPGIKIDVPSGSIVRAAEGGEVLYVGSGIKGYGNLVLIRHADGLVTVYAHLNNMMVKKGHRLKRGDALATVGMTGNVTRPMLHFEVRQDSKPVDPMQFLI